MRRGAAGMALVGAVVCTASCRPRPAGPSTVRLVDLHRAAAAAPRAPAGDAAPAIEWRFDRPGHGWTAYDGVSGLAVREGRLVGRATTTAPILHLARPPGADAREPVHALEIRMRVSAGASLAVELEGGDLERAQALDILRHLPLDFTAPLAAGEGMRTYSLRTQFSVVVGDARHVYFRPTDVAGATFEIESIRLVTRREHLAGVASGVGWHGLGEVYKETLAARAPETLRFEARLPARPVLDLSVGTVEDGPVRFRVRVEGAGVEPREVFARTVTRPHRWEPAMVDLSPWGGRTATLALEIEAERPGTIGFWGAPAIRGRVDERRGGTGKRPPPQGVILVMADTLRRDHMGVYGYPRPTTPVLDRLAREGVLFRDCVGQATWTKVSAPSLLTSLYPSVHGVKDFMDRLPSSAATLAEAYREAGYATLSLSSILFTGRFSNLHQGFEEVHEDSSLAERGSSKTAREYVDRLAAWLEAHRDVPFFVYFHVLDPHDPYRPAPPYDALWADPARSEEHERRGAALRKVIADPLLRNMGSAMPTRAEFAAAGIDAETHVGHDRGWYDGSIRGLDTEMGRLVERLRGLGLDRRTLFAFTADHGEEFLDHGRMLHGQSVYGELANTALILWGPGTVPAGVEVAETVQSIDVMPTLLDASGLRAPAAAQGRSLLPLIEGGNASAREGERWAARPAITEKAVTVDNGSPPPRDTESVAVVFEGWKLVQHVKRPPAAPDVELFHHQRDPLDRDDVAARNPEVVRRLSRELDAWRRSVASARLRPDAEAAAALSKEEVERLRALGYVQ